MHINRIINPNEYNLRSRYLLINQFLNGMMHHHGFPNATRPHEDYCALNL